MNDKYLNTKDAAEYIGYSPITLAQARKNGTLSGRKAPKHYGDGKATRYKRSELDKWVQKG